MTHQIAIAALSQTSAGRMEAGAATPARAAPEAARRFERLMYAPSGIAPTTLQLTTPAAASSGMRAYVEHLSHRWEAGQATLKSMLAGGRFTSKELVQTQVQMVKCALDIEVSSKCASIFESGVQTMVQRGGA